jgi:hypothetical protein
MVNGMVQSLAFLEQLKDLELLVWCILWPCFSLKKYGIAATLQQALGDRYATLPLHQMLLIRKIT